MDLRRNFIPLIFFLFHLMGTAQKSYGRPEGIEPLMRHGDSLFRAGKGEAAFLSYKDALDIAKDAGNIRAQAALYKKIGVFHYFKKKYAKAEESYRKSFRLDSISKTAADTYYNFSLLKRKKSEHDSVLPYLEKSIDLYKKLTPDASAYNAYLGTGTIYKNRQFYDKALELLLLAHAGFSDLNDLKQLAKVCSAIGNIHIHLKNYDQAFEFHRQALALGKSNLGKVENPNPYNNMAIVYKNLSKPDSAIAHYNKALELMEKDNPDYGKILFNLANLYKSTGKLDLANKNYRSSLLYKTKANDTVAVMYSYNGMSDLFLMKGNLESARAYLDSVKNVVHTIADKLVLLDYYNNEVSYHRKIRAYRSASDFQLRYSELFEKIYDLERTEIVQNMQSRFEYEKKINENLQLTLANQNNLLLLEQQRGNLLNKNWMLVLLGISVILLGTSYYIYVQKQRAKNQAYKIEKLEAIYQGQETIKKRIARDLHDIVAANFNGLRLKVLALPRASDQTVLAKTITSDIAVINDQVRKVSHRLYPLEMMAKGRPFTTIIKSQLAEFQFYTKIEVQLVQELPSILNELDVEIQNHIYSILLEILNNVAKHAQATLLNIGCKIDRNKKLHFTITDNGMGLDDSAKKGIGLMNIRQRTELLGGCSSIKKITEGTEVKLSFPV